jgi:hypothetical protein
VPCFQVGHQDFAWYIRTHPRVKALFAGIWGTEELVVSFDGSCWIPKDWKRKDSCWTHSDQAPTKIGLHCYQGLMALTNNKERSLVVFEGSHLLHQKYVSDRRLDDEEVNKNNINKNWFKIEPSYLHEIQHLRRVIDVEAGDMVLWDSRTFHQNQYGSLEEERIVQYVSYLPKRRRSQKVKNKRMAYFRDYRTTSHWADNVYVNGKQAQNYGNQDWVIDYSTLKKPRLSKEMVDAAKSLI